MKNNGANRWIDQLIIVKTLVGTGISFFVFMFWGFCLGAILFPIVRLVNPKSATNLFVNHVRFAWRFFAKVIVITGAVKDISVVGAKNLPTDSPCLLIGNHLTLIDIVVLGAQISNFNCVVKMSLWNHFFLGAVIKACDFIPNKGGEEFIERSRRGFENNRPLIIFPQGERTKPNEPIEFQRGAAQIAVRTGVPIVPFLVRCEPQITAKGVPWYRVSPSARLSIQIKEPLEVPQKIHSETSIPKKVRALNHYLEAYFEAELKQ